MHGHSECNGDIDQLCIMKHFPSSDPLGNYAYTDFLKCVGPDIKNIPKNTDSCLKSIGATDDIIEKVHTCAQGEEGKKLMTASIHYTLGRCGHHPGCRSCTMWLDEKKACVHDGGWKDCPVGHTVNEWVKAICDKYTGPDKPKACQ